MDLLHSDIADKRTKNKRSLGQHIFVVSRTDHRNSLFINSTNCLCTSKCTTQKWWLWLDWNQSLFCMRQLIVWTNNRVNKKKVHFINLSIIELIKYMNFLSHSRGSVMCIDLNLTETSICLIFNYFFCITLNTLDTLHIDYEIWY